MLGTLRLTSELKRIFLVNLHMQEMNVRKCREKSSVPDDDVLETMFKIMLCILIRKDRGAFLLLRPNLHIHAHSSDSRPVEIADGVWVACISSDVLPG